MRGMRSAGSLLLTLLGLLGPGRALAQEDAAGQILGASLTHDGAYEKLTYLSDRIGHRLSGSAALERAIEWTVAEFGRDGADRVWTETVMVPHWVRGRESARIVEPIERELALLTLGGSVGTAQGGLTAEVVMVQSLDELEQVGDAVEGKIVLFNKAMKAGFGAKPGYGDIVGMRSRGPSAAARLGAVGMMIRSIGTAEYHLPHTGALNYEDDAPRIPSIAISAEDAARIARLLRSGDTVRVRMELGAKQLPDAESANVIAELRGRELPDEIVLIGAHLDSWDVGDGAHDDGAGCAIVMEALALLKRNGLIPRRTIRAVLFTNEENGLRGGKDYARRHADELHVVAIETDGGGAAPVGFGVTAGPGGVEMIESLIAPLEALDAGRVSPKGGGADIGPLKKLGVPVMDLRQEVLRYFDYHHTEADTLDKVDPHELNRNLAALTLMAYALAEHETTLPRLETDAPAEN